MTVWNITIAAPTGTFDAALRIDGTGGNAVGEMSARKGSGPMRDLRFDATTIAWTTRIERPMPMKLSFEGEHDGDAMSGTVKFGMFASGTFSGTRA